MDAYEFLKNNGLKLLDIKSDKRDAVYVVDKDGIIYNSNLRHLRNGVFPSVKTAVDKNKWLEVRISKIHGDKYDCSNINYITSRTSVELICKIHGSFFITPNAIISKGCGCPKCSADNSANIRANSTDIFIEKSNSIHNNKYDYSLVKYNRQYDLINIICPNHGLFTQTAKDHMRGHGCPKCGVEKISKARSENPTGWKLSEWIKSSENSNEFSGFRVYIIKCSDDIESFIKVGRTYKDISKRFRTNEMLPYKYEIINEIIGDPFHIFKLEIKLKRLCKQYKYLASKRFNGMHECFTLDALEILKQNNYVNT